MELIWGWEMVDQGKTLNSGFFSCLSLGFGLLGDHCEWRAEVQGVSLDKASLALSMTLHPVHDRCQAAQNVNTDIRKSLILDNDT